MAQPTAYNPAHEFLTDEVSNPNFPGSEIDIELNALETTLDEILTNLALIQRDDGALKNGVVTTDSLDTTLAAALGDIDAIAEVEALIAAAAASATTATTQASIATAKAVLTAADAVATAADRVQTGLDVISTAADVVSTNADVILTAADRVQTGLDVISTAADVVSTNADALATAADAISTAADAVATAADRVQTGLDVTAAAASAAAAAASFDAFDDIYLGSKAADPTLDNDGNALVEGQLYWNSASNALKAYDGAAWQNYNPVAFANVVEDTTPQLGGQLDVNGFALGDGTLELLKFEETASAVNEVSIVNAATGNGPTLKATGDDTNIDLILSGKGTGVPKIGTAPIKSAGKETIWIPATAMVQNVTSGPSVGLVEQTTNKNMTRTLDFDTTTSENAQFFIAFPKSWNLGTVTFIPHWTAASGSGTVIWALGAVAISNDDALDVAFGTAQTSTDTLIAAYDNHVGPESAAITIGGTPAAGDLVNFRVSRDVSDTLGVDAKLIGIQVLFTTNAATDA